MTTMVLCLDAPATYRICVQGHLDDSGLDALEALTLIKDNRAGQAPQITLSGRFADQGALVQMPVDKVRPPHQCFPQCTPRQQYVEGNFVTRRADFVVGVPGCRRTADNVQIRQIATQVVGDDAYLHPLNQ